MKLRYSIYFHLELIRKFEVEFRILGKPSGIFTPSRGSGLKLHVIASSSVGKAGAVVFRVEQGDGAGCCPLGAEHVPEILGHC